MTSESKQLKKEKLLRYITSMFLFSIKFQILSCLPQLEIVKWISAKKQSTLLTTVHIHKSLANCTMDNLLWAVCAN